jgi:hypothetical protein
VLRGIPIGHQLQARALSAGSPRSSTARSTSPAFVIIVPTTRQARCSRGEAGRRRRARR